ncbi:Ig-like domain-containing alpha-2-macroglobulin family protein, partial [Petrocella sp. FN5]|uniref:Ig-like domain-containing alpha-2-macroglobulin family protein n=1 Tax=Petrocella sp. FN5 TaxID=3032002 RepID=UPI0023D9E2CA
GIKKWIRENKIGLVAGLVAVLMIGGLAYWFVYGRKPVEEPLSIDEQITDNYRIDAMEVKALEVTDQGVSTNSPFEIQVKGIINTDTLKRVLKVKPDKAYTISMKNEKDLKFELTFDAPLDAGEIVSVIYDQGEIPFGFAFQTQKILAVSAVYPAEDKEYVPTNTLIEVYFSKNIEASIGDYINLTPQAEGRVEVFNNVYRFIPKENLQPNTVYTLTIEEGYVHKDETLEGFETRFTTDYSYHSNQQLIYFLNKDLIYLNPNGVQSFRAYSDLYNEGESISIKAYPIKKDVTAIKLNRMVPKEAQTYLDANEEVSESPKMIKARYNIYDYYQGYVTLDENLSKGYYYLLLEKSDKIGGTLLQVTEFNGYLMADNDQLLVWLQSTGDNVLESVVSIDDTPIGSTNAAGLSVMPYKTPQNTFKMVKINTKEVQPLLMPLRTGTYEKQFFEDYWYYAYTDRAVYLPTDLVYVSGFVQHKNGKATQSVTIKRVIGDKILEEKTVALSKNGDYITSFEFEDYYGYGFDLQVFIGEEKLTTVYVGISQFEKPTVTMKGNTDKDIMMMGDEIVVSGEVMYYEGTPYTNPEIVLESDWNIILREGLKSVQFEGSENGHFEEVFIPYLDTTTWYPEMVHLYARLDTIDNYYDTIPISFIMLPRDMMTILELEKVSDAGFEMTYRAHEIDISKHDPEIFDGSNLKGNPIGDVNVEVTVKEIYYEKVFVGQSYDEVMKVTYDRFNYKRIENIVLKNTMVTDAQGVMSLNFDQVVEGRDYIVETVSYDGKGRVIKDTGYYGGDIYYRDALAYHQYAYLDSDQYAYGIDEEAHIFVNTEEGRLQGGNQDQMLFIVVKEGIYETYLSDTPSHTLKFKEDMIPTVYVQGVYFDGQYMHAGYNFRKYLQFDTDERKAMIDIEFEQSDYKPGDTVHGVITMKDKDGKPLEGYYNISVVDEAYFALYEDHKDPRSELYQWHYNTAILGETVATSKFIEATYGAEGGEGGDGSIRSDFKNTAYFNNGTTDEKGEANVSFKVPDNLTKWRVTVSGITQDLYVGVSKENLNVTLPYFVTALFADNFLEQDELGLTLRSTSKNVPRDTEADYRVEIKSQEGFDWTYEGKGFLNDFMYVPVGSLPLNTLEPGKYTVTIEGSVPGYKDRMSKSIQIHKSTQRLPLNHKEQVEENTIIKHNNQMVQISMMNPLARERYEMLSKWLYNHVEALEYKASGYMAYLEMEKLGFEVSHLTWLSQKPYYYLPENNLYNSTHSSDGSVITTVDLLQMGWGDVIENSEVERLKLGLYQKAMSDKTSYVESMAALYGLALLGEPMLENIRVALGLSTYKEEPLAVLYGIKALAYYGAYQEVIQALSEHFPSGNQMIGIDYIETEDPNQNKKNALLMAIYVDLNQEKMASSIHNRIQDLEVKGYITASECFYYTTHLPTNLLESVVEVSINKQKEIIRLGYDDVWHRTLTANEAMETVFLPINGETTMITNYIGSHQDVEVNNDLEVETRIIAKEGSISVGDLITVEHKVKVHKPITNFEVMDVLPAGLVFVGNVAITSNEVNMLAYNNNEGRSAQFYTYAYHHNTDKLNDYEFVLTYQARAITIGNYGYEPIVIFDTKNQSYTKGEGIKVEIIQ